MDPASEAPQLVIMPMPACFAPVTVPATRHSVSHDFSPFKYRNLSKHTLTMQERLWLCRECDLKNGVRPDQITTKKGVIRRYQLPRNFFNRNFSTYLKYGHCLPKGGQTFVDESGDLAIKKAISDATYNRRELSMPALMAIATKEAASKKRSRGEVDPTFNFICPKTLKSYMKKNKIETKAFSSHITEARESACLCPYMSYAWYIVCLALSNKMPSTNKWNADGSTYVFHPATTGERCVRLCRDDEIAHAKEENTRIAAADLPENPSISSGRKAMLARGGAMTNTSNHLPFAIKVMHMCSAAGECSAFVAVLSVTNFEKEQWHVEEVVGLSHTRPLETGYLYFSKNRCGTEEMWKHYFLNVVIATIKKSCDLRTRALLSSTEVGRSFFSTDGEAIIMKNAYKDDVRQAFDICKIDYGRVGAATTAIHNACDRAHTFRDTKITVRKLLKDDRPNRNTALKIYLQLAFDTMKKKFPSTLISAQYVKLNISGLMVLVDAYQSTMTPQKIRWGFSVCGQDCPPDKNGSTIDFVKMMHQSYSDISQQQLTLMYDMGPHFATMMQLEGRITHESLLEAGILPGTTTIDRNSLTWVRHWSEIVSHEQTVQRYRAELESRDPERLREAREQAAAQRSIEKGIADDAKKQARANLLLQRKQIRLAQQHTEAARFEALPREEQKAERRAKRQAAQARKLAKQAVGAIAPARGIGEVQV